MADNTGDAPDGVAPYDDTHVMGELLMIRGLVDDMHEEVKDLHKTLETMQENAMEREKGILDHMRVQTDACTVIVDFLQKKKDKAKRKAKRTNKGSSSTEMVVSDISSSSSAAPLDDDETLDASAPSATEREQVARAMGACMSAMIKGAIATGTPGTDETEEDVRARFGEHVHWVTAEEAGKYKFGANCGTPSRVKKMVLQLLYANLDPTVICANRDGNIYFTPKDFEGYTAKYGW